MKQEKWILKGGRGKEIQEATHLPPFLCKVIAARLGEESLEAYLNKEAPLFSPEKMADMKKAASRIQKAAREGEKVAIIGDYDVDGMTSSSILYLGLHYLFPSLRLLVRIPDRVKDGYGFNKGMAEQLVEEEVQLFLTCDNGIREFPTADYLTEAGIDLIVTDHHEIEQNEASEDILPKALAIINPHRADDASPCKTICGAFVAYQLIRYLALEKGIDPETDPLLLQLKGYAAIGTICDVMPLVQDNRRIVYQGLKALEKDPTVGIRELMRQGSVDHLDPYTVGFVIGPMINSGGRLGSQEAFLEVLTSSDPAACREKALTLYALNKERQKMTDEGIEEGLSQMNEDPEALVKVIYLPELHESIAGLVAGKLREASSHPVFVVTKTEGKLKGSGRSMEAYHMFNEMNKHPELYEKFGGHAMAAGFTLKSEEGKEMEAVQSMRALLNGSCELTREDLIPIVYIDAAVDPTKLKVDSVRLIDQIGPFGTGNPKPSFACKNLRILRCQIFGKRRNVMRIAFEAGMAEGEAVYFQPEAFLEFLKEAYGEAVYAEAAAGRYLTKPCYMDIVFQSEIDEYYGVPTVKHYLRHYRKSANEA